MQLKVKKLCENAKIPTRNKPDDAGLDLYSVDDTTILGGGMAMVKTGIAIDMGWQKLDADEAYVALIWDRSGVATKKWLTKVAGVIDSGYRGEIIVALHNFSTVPVHIAAGEKIAQMLVMKVQLVEPFEVEELSNSQRGDAGFGSSGSF